MIYIPMENSLEKVGIVTIQQMVVGVMADGDIANTKVIQVDVRRKQDAAAWQILNANSQLQTTTTHFLYLTAQQAHLVYMDAGIA